uniref:Uncharacterized protein n=1 Tax=Siphoviridae sp. ctNlb4 TaxID=2826305 RepID=A0A8S5QUJ5_9CAUD|nr:MAG TPA: hypothetical protein [Siphoviridae sp. ctNlb4]
MAAIGFSTILVLTQISSPNFLFSRFNSGRRPNDYNKIKKEKVTIYY